LDIYFNDNEIALHFNYDAGKLPVTNYRLKNYTVSEKLHPFVLAIT